MELDRVSITLKICNLWSVGKAWSVSERFTNATYADHSKIVCKAFTDQLEVSKCAFSDQL
jgi:hypothetical protein